MGRDIAIIAAKADTSDAVILEYLRADDGTLWSFACKLAGDRVMWASVNNSVIGRWRDHPADEKITFDLSQDKVSITQKFVDGSTSSGQYPRK